MMLSCSEGYLLCVGARYPVPRQCGVVSSGTRGTEVFCLAEVGQYGAGGTVHPVKCIAGVRLPAGPQKLESVQQGERERKKEGEPQKKKKDLETYSWQEMNTFWPISLSQSNSAEIAANSLARLDHEADVLVYVLQFPNQLIQLIFICIWIYSYAALWSVFPTGS